MTGMTAAICIDDGPEVQGELFIEVEQVDVTPGTKTRPDMAWEFVDDRGHFHAFDADGNLPTLEARSEHRDCTMPGEHDDDCEGYYVTVYTCSICGQIIEPQYVVTHPAPGSEFMPGRMHWNVEVHQELERGQRVSVAMRAGDEMCFGVGIVGNVVHAEGRPDGVHVVTAIHGAGVLGRRKRATVPV
jgi:hypothetical protein